MTGPDQRPAADRGHLRAASADREHVVAVLKAAFVQGRLDQDELDARVGQALASRTYADLAALTADIPAGPDDAGPTAAGPAGTPARTLGKATRRAGVCLLIAIALFEGSILADSFGLLFLASCALMAASGFFGYGIVDAWHERRSPGRLPPRPDRDGRGLDAWRSGRTGDDPELPGARTDPTRTDLRARRPGPARRHPPGRGWKPARSAC